MYVKSSAKPHFFHVRHEESNLIKMHSTSCPGTTPRPELQSMSECDWPHNNVLAVMHVSSCMCLDYGTHFLPTYIIR